MWKNAILCGGACKISCYNTMIYNAHLVSVSRGTTITGDLDLPNIPNEKLYSFGVFLIWLVNSIQITCRGG